MIDCVVFRRMVIKEKKGRRGSSTLCFCAYQPISLLFSPERLFGLAWPLLGDDSALSFSMATPSGLNEWTFPLDDINPSAVWTKLPFFFFFSPFWLQCDRLIRCWRQTLNIPRCLTKQALPLKRKRLALCPQRHYPCSQYLNEWLPRISLSTHLSSVGE